MSDYVEYLLLYSASSANILAITSVCNVACVFCSHAHNPPAVTTYKIPPLSLDKIMELADYLDPKQKIVIGESVTAIDEGEPFTHPDLLAILKSLRQKFPQTVVQITTNGSLLDEAKAAALAAIGRIEINLSLNSASLEGRTTLMRDGQAVCSIKSPEVLVRFGIPYHGSIVGMPHLVGWEDIESTCRYLAKRGAQTIRLFIPGYTRYAPETACYPTSLGAEFRQRTVALADQLRTPLTLEPFVPNHLRAYVEGVIARSPAARCGLQRGDILLRISNQPVRSRVDAFQKLLAGSKVELEYERDGVVLRSVLRRNPEERPGVVMYHDIDFALVDRLSQLLTTKRAQKAAVLTSALAFPLWSKVLSGMPGVDVYEVPNRFFGGMICCAGLLVVSDYQATLQKIPAQDRPNLVVVPQISFNAAGRDLTGASYQELGEDSWNVVTL